MNQKKVISIIGVSFIFVGTILIFLLKVSCLPNHILGAVLVFIGVVDFTIIGAPAWKYSFVGVTYRLFFLVALITGIVMASLKIYLPHPLAIVHVCFYCAFLIFFVIAFISNYVLFKKKSKIKPKS